MRNASAKIRYARSALPRPHGRGSLFGQMMARKGRNERDAATIQRKKGPKQSMGLGPV